MVDESGNGIRYRLQSHERRIQELERRTENVNVHANEIQNLWAATNNLAKEVGDLRKAIITAAVSFAGGALLVAFTIFQAFG
jgi:DNA anti-recombination protein RmuC